MLIVAGLQVPVMPFVEVPGRAGAGEPLQTGPRGPKVGMVPLVTVMDRVVTLAHCPALGVKVYVADAELFTIAGLQVPVIPFSDVVGRTGAVLPVQKAAIGVNVGTVLAVTVVVREVCDAHCPALGVKVYEADARLFTVAGLHVPVMPFNDVAGKTGTADPLQKAGIGVKVGTVPAAVTVTVSVAGVAH